MHTDSDAFVCFEANCFGANSANERKIIALESLQNMHFSVDFVIFSACKQIQFDES